MSAAVKPVRVAPTVTDPSMQSRTQAEAMLAELGGETDDISETVFARKRPTKEEQMQQQAADAKSSDNTIMVIVFALIVVALVAIIIWMIMKQGNDKKDEEEIRRMVRPQPGMQQHPRNGMPAMHRYPIHQQQQMQHMQQQQMMRQQRARQQARQGEEDDGEDDDESQEQPKASKEQSKKQTKEGKADKSSKKQTKEDDESEEESDDETKPPKASKYTMYNPNPVIMRPGQAPNTSDVDDVMTRAAAMLQTDQTAAPQVKAVKMSSKTNSAMTDADKALLDRVERDAADTAREEDE